MQGIPHLLSVTGYFEGLKPEALTSFCGALAEISARPGDYFSLENEGGNLDTVEYGYQIITPTETLKSDSTGVSVLGEFAQVLQSQDWEDASLRVEHARWTPKIGLRLLGAHLGESLQADFHNELGSCTLNAHLKNREATGSLLTRLLAQLELAEKPRKASRYIPEWLETKLLCDSMHLCNVCRDEGVIVHHIVPVESGGETVENNLIVLCLKHHHLAHSKSTLVKNLRPEHLREYKQRHLLWVALRGTPDAASPIAGDAE